MPSLVCSTQASYKKLPGFLELTSSHLQWTKAGDKVPAVKVPYAEASCTSQNASVKPRLTASSHPSFLIIRHLFLFVQYNILYL